MQNASPSSVPARSAAMSARAWPHAGHDVTLIDPWPAHVEAIRANGMNLYGMTEAERRTVQVNAMHITELQQLAKQRPIDIAFISVKSYDTIWATPDDPAVPRRPAASSSRCRTA